MPPAPSPLRSNPFRSPQQAPPHADQPHGNPKHEPAFSGFTFMSPRLPVAGADAGHPLPPASINQRRPESSDTHRSLSDRRARRRLRHFHAELADCLTHRPSQPLRRLLSDNLD